MVTSGFLVMDSTKSVGEAKAADPYDLIYNMEASAWAKALCGKVASPGTFVVGPCTPEGTYQDLPFANDERGQLSSDPDWTSPALTEKYPFLNSHFIGEILCRLAYLDGVIPAYSVPIEPALISIPDVLIAVSASSVEKLWPTEKWIEILTLIKQAGLTVGLIGAHPLEQQRYWVGNSTEGEILDKGYAIDFRGRLRLPQVVGALMQARAVLSIDNGVMHLAAAVNVPVVGLFREDYHRLWAPPVPSLQVMSPGREKGVADIGVGSVRQAVSVALQT